MKHSAQKLTVVAVASVLLGFGSPATAIPIAYQVRAVASGMLGGSSFTDALVTLTLTADTANVVAASLGGLANLGTTTVNIPGIGTSTVTDPTAIFSTVIPIVPDVGFPFLPYVSIAVLDHPPSTASNVDIGVIGSSVLLGYDLRTSIGPITGVGGLLYDAGFLHTTLGNLAFTSPFLPTSQGTFAATLVPEPSSLLLMCAGVVGLAARLRTRWVTSRRAEAPRIDPKACGPA